MKNFILLILGLCLTGVISAKTLDDFIKQVQQDQPFIEHKEGDLISFIVDDGVTVNGKFIKINDKGIIVEIEEGVGIRYNYDRLTLESKRKLYRKEYEAYIKELAELEFKDWKAAEDERIAREAEKEKQRKAEEEFQKTEQEKKDRIAQFLNDLFQRKTLAGYTIGESYDGKNIIRKNPDGSLVVKASKIFLKTEECTLYLDPNNKIYEINIRNDKIEFYPFTDFWRIYKSIYPDVKEIATNTYIYIRNDMSVEWAIVGEYGDHDEAGRIAVGLRDNKLMPYRDRISRTLATETDTMAKVTWYSLKRNIVHEESGDIYAVIPYIGKFENGNLVMRLGVMCKTSKRMFLREVQFQGDFIKDVHIETSIGDVDAEYSKGLRICTETADVIIKDDELLKLLNSETVRVRFYGNKRYQDFELSPDQVKDLNILLDYYTQLKNGK